MADVAADKTRRIQEKLSEWERPEAPLAPLSFQQRDGVLELSQAAGWRHSPEGLATDTEDSHPEPGNVTLKKDADPHRLTNCFEKLRLGEVRIESAQQFLSWYSEVEAEIAEEEDVQYEVYMKQLMRHNEECVALLSQVETSLSELSKLGEQYHFVSNKTNSLHEACEQLLADQAQLNAIAETVEAKLSYFTELDRVSQKLNSPIMSVTNESFIPMLSKLDDCIAYMNANPKYKESPAYLAKLKQCQSRALGMIRTYVFSAFQSASQQPTQNEQKSSTEASFSLYYGRLRACAPKLKPLLSEVERRCNNANTSEYQQLLSDCQRCYVTQREEVLSGSVGESVGALVRAHTRDHCTLVRSGCALLVRLCEDEHQLYAKFFEGTSDHLTAFLEGMCLQLYDALRPSIIHVNHLETLAELCTILRMEMLDEHVHVNPGPLEAFERVASQLLQDVQERLVYRTHIYIQTDILNYNPAPGDLAYPEKLEMMESIAESLQHQHQQMKLRQSELHSSASSLTSVTSQEVAQITGEAEQQKNLASPGNSPADLHGMWYPPVRRTLVCLSKLYRCLDRSICQGLAQEALNACIQSVASAAQAISKRKSPLDGHLFLIKHLLIVREQIAPFHVEFSVRETSLDFSRVRSAAAGLVHKRARLFSLNSSNALLEFLLEGTPQVKEYCRDSKKEVDRQLKLTCEAFVEKASQGLIGPLPGFLSKCQLVQSLASNEAALSAPKLKDQPFASADKVATVVSEALRSLKAGLGPLRRTMQLYLANRETEFILFRPVKNGVLGFYVQLQQIVKQSYSEEEQVIIGCPTQEQVSVLISSLMNRSEERTESRQSVEENKA